MQLKLVFYMIYILYFIHKKILITHYYEYINILMVDVQSISIEK